MPRALKSPLVLLALLLALVASVPVLSIVSSLSASGTGGVWRHLIDPVLTAHAQPVGINKGTLFVNVDSSVWLDEIVRYRRKEILNRLQLSFGRELIQRISFRVG